MFGILLLRYCYFKLVTPCTAFHYPSLAAHASPLSFLNAPRFRVVFEKSVSINIAYIDHVFMNHITAASVFLPRPQIPAAFPTFKTSTFY